MNKMYVNSQRIKRCCKLKKLIFGAIPHLALLWTRTAKAEESSILTSAQVIDVEIDPD